MGSLSTKQSGRLPKIGAGTQELSFVLRNALRGRLNNTGTFTLTANAASTTVTDERVGLNSVVLFMPTTASAATEFGAGSLYITVNKQGTFDITHANTADADKTFSYVIFG